MEEKSLINEVALKLPGGGGVRVMKIDLSDITLVRELMMLINRIYRHEQTPKILKTYIYFEMRKFLGDRYDVKGFLESNDEQNTL